MEYACGDLTPPLTSYVSYEDVFGKPRNKLFRANIDFRIYPDFFNYECLTGATINLNPYGTCFMCTSVNWAKWLVYVHTGKRLNFTLSEVNNAVHDVNGLSDAALNAGGHLSGVKALFHYNEKSGRTQSALITNFISVCNSVGINENNVCNSGITANRNNVIKVLNNIGPCYWSHNPTAYCSTNGRHAILIIGYDNDYVYFKGSWSSNDDDHTYKHFGKVSFSSFTNDNGLLFAYGPAGYAFKNL